VFRGFPPKLNIRVLVFTTLRTKLGWKERTLSFSRDNVSLREVFEKIPQLKNIVLDENGDLKKGYIVLINGINCSSLGKLEAKLRNGDVVSIFPPAGGG